MTDYTDTTPSILQEELVRIAKRAHTVYAAAAAAVGYKIIPASWEDMPSQYMGESMDLCKSIAERALNGWPDATLDGWPVESRYDRNRKRCTEFEIVLAI